MWNRPVIYHTTGGVPISFIDHFRLDFPACTGRLRGMSTPDLRGIRILADMTNDQVDALMSFGEVLRFAPGEKLVKQGEPANALYLLMEGKISAYSTDARGNETHLRTTETGGHFGEIGVLESGVRTATVKAISDCAVFRMDAQQFRNLLKSPDLAAPLLHGLSRSLAIRLADITNRFSELRALKDPWMV